MPSVPKPDYRWIIVAVSSLTLAVTMGQLVNGMSVYFLPLEAAMGWTRAEIAMINTAGLAGLAIGSALMGILADRLGTRPVVLFGIAVTGAMTFLASQAQSLLSLYVLFFLAGALGGGAIFGPVMSLVGAWFRTGAGLAIGVVSAGQALGQGGIPFAGAFLVEMLGWRGALATQGIVTLLLLLPLALLLRDPPRDPAPVNAAPDQSTPSGLPNGLVTAWLSVAVLLCCTCMAVPLMHLVPMMQGRGVPAAQAGSILFLMLVVAIAGRVAFGQLADRIGALPAYLTASAWQTVMIFGFVLISRLDAFYLYAAIYGFGYAGVMTTVLVTARNLTAPARRASSMGIILAFAWMGHGLGGWQGGAFFDLTGDYTMTFANGALAGVLNLVVVGTLWLTVRQRRYAGMAAA